LVIHLEEFCLPDEIWKDAGSPVKRLLVAGFCLVLLTKLILIFTLDLYSDEIFYWQESTRPALAYSDLPFMTSLLIGIGTSLGTDHAFSARFLFLLMGSSLPLLVYWVARPITNQQQALESALLTMCLPLAAFLGVLAVPDVPLLCFGLLALGGFERALRSNEWKFWLLTGIAVACGLSTHYRFFLYPLSAILFLVCYRPARSQWLNPRFWSAVSLASVGLFPILWFNITNALSSANFYFVDRHPWEFQPTGLLHVFKQAGLVTPLLYGVLVYVVWRLLERARAGNREAMLMLCFALSHLLVYLVLAPWTDATSTSIHWPLSGYLPLLVFTPSALRDIHVYYTARRSAAFAHRLLISIPALGFTGALVALAGIGSQALQQQLQPILGTDILSNKMAGWQEFAQHTQKIISTHYEGYSPVIVTDNYYTAAQTEFAGLTGRSYTLDEDKAVRDGRSAQLRLWQIDETGLLQESNKPLLFISEDSTLTVPAKFEIMNRICRISDAVDYLGELVLFSGAKRFSYYSGRLTARSETSSSAPFYPCPYPAQAWLDSPDADAVLSDTVPIAGWAFNEDIGIESVHLILDNTRVAQLDYGSQRPDVVEAMQVQSDPEAPALGFNGSLDTRKFPNGRHTLKLEIINNKGMVIYYGERTVRIAN